MITSINEYKKQDAKLVVYHRSDSLEHMKKSEFDLEYANVEDSIFGRALYFASSSHITTQLGKYICKFEITLEAPTLDLNKEMTAQAANKLMREFMQKYGTEIAYYNREKSEHVTDFDFNDDYNRVQYGEFFLEIQWVMKNNANQHFQDFIQSMGYNSFKHYCDYGSNFTTENGDYGYCYGIYNPKDIKFVDGPF